MNSEKQEIQRVNKRGDTGKKCRDRGNCFCLVKIAGSREKKVQQVNGGLENHILPPDNLGFYFFADIVFLDNGQGVITRTADRPGSALFAHGPAADGAIEDFIHLNWGFYFYRDSQKHYDENNQ